MMTLTPNRLTPALFAVLVALSPGAAQAQSLSPSLRLLEASPLSFERNVGQADARARLVARSNGYTLLLTADGPLLRVPGTGDVQMTLVGGQTNAALTEEAPLPGVVNYFIGNDPTRWRTDIPTFARARYTQVYPGIDLVYYGAKGRLEYDFVVAPGSDPASIAMKFSGVAGIDIEDDGDLALRVGGETLTMEKPTLYQEIAGARRTVSGSFRRLPTGAIGFDVGEYDRTWPLVIDPVLAYATYLGYYDTSASGIAVDNTGAAYVLGWKRLWLGIQTVSDVFVAKLNATGSALLFTTYLGGLESDSGTSIRLDATGNIYVAGSTLSWDFPVVSAAQPSLPGGFDGFLLKLAPAGNVLLYSTFVGGSGTDNLSAMDVDGAGNAYVVGRTLSADFPLAAPIQASRSGGQDAFLAGFDSSGNRVFSTYLGGTGDDFARAVAVSSDTVVLAGQTYSLDFPITGDAAQPALSASQDGFVVRVRPTDSALVYSSYFGGTGSDTVSDLAVDGAGATYLVGSTDSGDFFTTPGVVHPADPSGSTDGFVAKLASNLSSFVYSTYLRGPAAHVDADGAGRAVVTGTASSGIPLVTPLQPVPFSTDADGALFKLAADGSAYAFSTYWAGGASSVALDAAGDVYLASSVFRTTLPTTSGALQTSIAGTSLGALYIAKVGLQTPPCSFHVRPDYAVVTHQFLGTYNVITVVAPSGCNWTAVTDSPDWIDLPSTSGAGVGTALYRVTSTTASTRAGTITIADKVVAILQPASSCSYLVGGVSPQPSSSGSTTTTVTAPAGCPWVVTSFAPWLSSGSTGIGSGTVTLQLQANPSFGTRTATFRVSDSNYQLGVLSGVSQAGVCDVALSPSGTINVPSAGGVGLIMATVSPPTCSWNVSSTASWLTYSTANGTGSGTLTYTAQPHPFGRTGYMMVGGQLLSFSQGTGTITNIPAVLPPSPPAGSGVSRTFTFTFRDQNGATNLDVVNILYNNFLDGRFGCYLAYARAINVLYLVNDPGDALLPGMVVNGSPQTLSNGQCAIDGSGSSAVTLGSVLTLTLEITFNPAFAGNKVVYQAARDLNGNNSGWVQQGVWHVPGGAPGSPAVVSMTPARGGGRAPYPLQFTFRDANGYTDLVSTTVLMNSYLDGGSACYLGYHVPSNAVLLLNDAGNGYLPWLVLGATGSVENSQCRIYSQGSGSMGSDTDLTLTLMIEFKAGFAGERVFYLSAQDGVATSGWQAMGSWTVP